MIVEAYPEKCVFFGSCVMQAPDVFDQNDDGVVVVLNERPPSQLHNPVRRAASLCPAKAIAVRDPAQAR